LRETIERHRRKPVHGSPEVEVSRGKADRSSRIMRAPFSKDGFMIGKLGLPELAVIFGIALLIFGPSKIGELGKSLGEGIRGFKSALTDNDPAVKKP